ncbi:MAG: precorrin-6y C5,15-methyltransferase (decarboxylating) subunit CbiE [Syntrophobacteraceae bacterium]|nr:precorrin-6y C5,15-methyltransferase (decarboxylating) subunit CbiE [Syntrophobacteraceae bacterium]
MTRTSPEQWTPPLVILIGMGTDREDLSIRAMGYIEHAEVLAGGKRHLAQFPEHSGTKIPLQSPLDAALEEIERVSRERRTVVLASGDPFFFGIGPILARKVGEERLFTLPNVTSPQVLFSRISQPWDRLQTVSFHGKETRPAHVDWLRLVQDKVPLACFTDEHRSPAWIAERLIEAGQDQCVLVIGEDLGSPRERIHRLSPAEAVRREYSPLNVVAVLPEEPMSPEGESAWEEEEERHAIFGLGEEAFRHQAGMITKAEIRAVVLAQLQLCDGLTLWDLGAGSGSIGIEASRIIALKDVIAVERDAARYEDLRHNIRKLGRGAVRALHGDARALIDDLPDPDRVFIGGGGKPMETILEKIVQRLRPKGRVVQNLVTLESLCRAVSFWQGASFEFSVIQVQVNRSAALGSSFRFEPLNPIFVITAWAK